MPVTLNKKYARPIGGKLCNNSLVETMGLKTTNPLSQQVANIFAKYGTDAHVYMPGPGIPILGAELFTNYYGLRSSAAGNTYPATVTCTTAGNYGIRCDDVSVVGKSYCIKCTWSGNNEARPLYSDIGTKTQLIGSGVSGSLEVIVSNIAGGGGGNLYMAGGLLGEDFTIHEFSVKEVLGYSNSFNGLTAGNFLESTGNTYSAVDGLVGLDLDAGGTVGPELIADTSFDNPAYWSLSATAPATAVVSGSQVSLVSPAGEMSSIERFNAFTTGKTYRVELDIAYFTGTAAIYSGSVTIAILGIGKFVAHITTNNQTIGIKRLGNCNLVVRSISIKEVTGIHASQATTGYKPYLRRGAINLVNYSEQLDNAYWTKASSTTGTPGNDGLSLISATAATSFICRSDIATTVGVDYTLSVDLKKDTTTDPAIRVMTAANAANVGRLAIDWTGDAPIAGGIIGDVRDVSIVDKGNGVFRVSFKTAATSTVSSVLVYTTGAGAALKNVYAGKIQFQQGTLTDYIRTTSAPASSQSGNYFWQFDGIDDRLTLGSVPFVESDDYAIIAGANCTKATGWSSIFAIGGGTNSRIQLGVNPGLGRAIVSFISEAGVSASIDGSSFIVGKNIVFALTNKSNVKKLLLNNTQEGASLTHVQGACTLTSANIGALQRASATDFHKGDIYAIVAIKGTVSDADLLAIEKWVGKLSGVTI